MCPAISFVKKGHTAWLTLDRPAARNMIDQQMAQEWESVCLQIGQDDDVYSVVVTGTGEAFCVGSEPEVGPAGRFAPARSLAGIYRPVIAAINGDAIGEGLEIALACDIRIASDKAHFALPQVSRGLIPTDGGTQRLARIVGRAKAMELLFTAETIDAEEALAIGLVNRVVPAAGLMKDVEAMVQKLNSQAPLALRFAKEAVNKGLDMTLAQGLRLEGDLYFLLQTTVDRTEGITAFLEKRPPRFQGR